MNKSKPTKNYKQNNYKKPYNKNFNNKAPKNEVKYKGVTYPGKIIANARGFAFCVMEDETIDDVFIAPPSLNGALNNDKVMIAIIKATDEKREEGKVIEIVERGTHQIVGQFHAFKNIGFVISDDKRFTKDIYIPSTNVSTAKNGDKVVCRIISYGEDGQNPQGDIIEVIGDPTAKGNDILSIIRLYELYEEFPAEVKEAAKKVPTQVDPKTLVGREDLRNVLTCTIDGEDAKDFDDAISISKNPDGTYELGVHIADVGEYVERGSVLDKEAFIRATSVYFPDRVLPMLPVELSNGICSLNPKVDRLCLSVLMKLDANAKVIDYKICESVINSNERMTYNDVYAVLCGDKKLTEKYATLAPSFFIMSELNKKLTAIRNQRGALDLDIPECYIKVDENGRTCDIVPRERNEAHMLIESFMILANEVIAEHFNNLAVPFVYRIHEKPTEEKMLNFFAFSASFGLTVIKDAANILPKDLQEMLVQIKDLPYARTLSEVLLRSLQKAKYTTKCLGHFGLASTYYCHFTSPIRRYPDLVIHRIIKQVLRKKMTTEDIVALNDFTFEASVQSSEREKLAEKAERDVDAYKKAEYMQNFIGTKYEANVTGVTQSGLFVGLPNTVEGFISILNLPNDIYKFNEKTFSLNGNSNKFYIGQDLNVELLGVNLPDKKIDFKFVSYKK